MIGNRFLVGMRDISVALAALAFAGSSTAQLLKYENEQELMGAAVSSPDATKQILERLLVKCGSLGGPLRASGNGAMESWLRRHSAYLAEGRAVKAELLALYTHPEARQAFLDMVEKQLPAAVDRQYQVYAGTVDSVQAASRKIEICNSYVEAIVEGKFDLKNNDPTLANYLEKRIRTRKTSSQR